MDVKMQKTPRMQKNRFIMHWGLIECEKCESKEEPLAVHYAMGFYAHLTNK